MKIANRDARDWVEKRKPFKGSNLFGETRPVYINGEESPQDAVYTVYSYGYHFPMFAYTNGQWFENSDRYSRTTAKHKGQARPYSITTIKLPIKQLQTLIQHGYTAFVRRRLEGGVV